MTARVGLLVLLAAACGGDAPEAIPEARAAATGAQDPGATELYRSDHRIAPLLVPCAQPAYYDRDTGDMLPVLIEKLQKGLTEPLQRSKDELARMDESAMAEVRRLAERHFADPAGSSYAQNALDVAVISETETAREIVLRFLEHPREVLRRLAIRGLSLHHARPEDFETLWVHLESENLRVQELLVPALHAADPLRAELLFLDVIEAGTYTNLWPALGGYIAHSREPDTALRAGALAESVPGLLRPFLAACAARAGDARALQVLRDETLAPDDLQRERAAQAAALAGLTDLLLSVVSHDPEPGIRRIAITALGAAEPTEATDARLHEALSDPDRGVRLTALRTLVDRRDEAASDLALSMLGRGADGLQDVLFAARDRMLTDPDFARRAFELLRAADRDASEQPLSERTPVLKAIGTVPGRDSAQYLRVVALTARGVVSGLRPHELLMLHASNSGPEGTAYLYEELEQERDPLRRLDLIYAMSAHPTDAARERLQELVASDGTSPYELLYAADLLARLGPAADVAPVLKRVCYRIEQEDVRLAMRCLLWRWY